MKKLQCELCGSIEIIKTDNDLFQCQMCGCKYTLEQAKSLISGVVETTIGNSEFNRLVSNAETQIKLGNYVEAIINTDLMMNEFPNRYQGYWLFLKCIFSIIEKRKNLSTDHIYESKFNGFIHRIDLCTGEKVYKNLLTISEDSSEITKEQVMDYWESSIQKIVKGIINGKIGGLYEAFTDSDYNVHSSLINLRKEGINNEKLLLKHNLCMHSVSDKECEWFLNFGKYAFLGHLLFQPKFILDKKVIYKGYSELPDYSTVKDIKSFYPIKNNIHNIIAIAQANVDRVVFKENRCPKCFKPLHKSLFGKLKCSQCDFSSSMIDRA